MSKTNSITPKDIDITKESVFDAIKYMTLIRDIVVNSDSDEGIRLDSISTQGLFLVLCSAIRSMEDSLHGLDNLSNKTSVVLKEVSHG